MRTPSAWFRHRLIPWVQSCWSRRGMNGVIWTVGILIAITLTASGIWVHWLMVDMTVVDATHRSSMRMGGYPPLGTPAFYSFCAIEILKLWQRIFFPFAVGALASAYTLLELLGARVSISSIRPSFGFSLIVICLVASLDLVTYLKYGYSNFPTWFSWPRNATDAVQLPWPAVAMLIWPPSWRYALIVLSFWAGCSLCILGILEFGPIYLVAGLALTVLNIYPIYLHRRTPPRSSNG